MVSRVIEDFERAKVSHTAIVFRDPSSAFNHELYEAAWSGFRMSTCPKLESGKSKIVREIPVDLDPFVALRICRQWLQTPYDYLGLLGEAPVMIGKLFGQRWDNWFAGPHHMYCSEAATLLAQQAPGGEALKRLVMTLRARTTDPASLLQVLS
jgi:hypothetical protein